MAELVPGVVGEGDDPAVVHHDPKADDLDVLPHGGVEVRGGQVGDDPLPGHGSIACRSACCVKTWRERARSPLDSAPHGVERRLRRVVEAELTPGWQATTVFTARSKAEV